MFEKARDIASNDRQAQLARIDQLIAEGDRRIEQQRRIVSQIVDEEGDPTAAITLLKALEDAQNARLFQRSHISNLCGWL